MEYTCNPSHSGDGDKKTARAQGVKDSLGFIVKIQQLNMALCNLWPFKNKTVSLKSSVSSFFPSYISSRQ